MTYSRADALHAAVTCGAIVLASCAAAHGGAAWAKETPLDGSAKASDDIVRQESVTEARRLFQKGEVHYSLGEYQNAIAKFREAYQLSRAPGLLFNLAQAHRLNDDCGQALEIYSHFTRLSPNSPQAGEALQHMTTLESRCPRHSPIKGSAAEEKPAPGVALRTGVQGSGRNFGEDPRTPYAQRRMISRVLLLAGLGIGAGTGLLYWWNDSRHERWADEDRVLVNGPDGAGGPAGWVARQNRNDALLRSIWKVDTGVTVLAILSGACVIGAATIGLLNDKGLQVALAPGRLELGWSIPWP